MEGRYIRTLHIPRYLPNIQTIVLNADRSVIRLFLTPEKKVSPKRQKPSEAIKMIKYKVLHCTDNPNSIKGSKIKNKKGRRRNKISAIK
ncbi:hypothetical protein DW828_18880 [Parabacteroides merdae]|jgi:hypothetical protein|uniref:Uncharacterized protein n=1 Tax=Parabacteroides merdae TaxID=46503 RepID=A0A414BSA9_9BACT|nr:hypothetical protein DW828_18880 [Parabacteroides merdae]